jgi:(2Fe-2S) ferredoxin
MFSLHNKENTTRLLNGGYSVNDNPNQQDLFFRHHVFFCVNEREKGHRRGCCKEKGSLELREYMKAKAKKMKLKRIRINASGCLDRCELGPSVVIYPEGIWYTCKTTDDVDRILEDHIRDGGRANHLLMPKN